LLHERRRLFHELEQSNRDLAGKVQELEQKSEMIRRDLERAEVIQRALLPAQPPNLVSFTANALHRPGRYVGGDLYNVTAIGDDHLAFYVADATGHGVSSAMLSVLFHRRLRLTNESGRPLPPALVLENVNRALAEDHLTPGLFVTVAYGLLDLRRGEVQFAAAGHPPALLRRQNGQIERLLRTGPAIGLVANARYGQVRVQLSSGDRMLLLTDGILGSAANGTAWQPIESALAEGKSGHEFLSDLLVRVADSTSSQGDRDDLTLLLVEAAGGVSRFDNGEMRDGRESRPSLVATHDSTLWYGEQPEDDRGRRWLAVRGRGTWTACDLFHETAAGLLEEGFDLVIDLSACDYLDSTFLGTLHELVGRGGTGEGPPIALCGVSEPLRAAFEELDMERVLQAVCELDGSAPALQPLSPAYVATDRRQRVLRAHEALASLSARNRQKFLAVVETIRSQLE
jgi:serine phosphatase RsbU (regulator of sigma subunit)/anti-anti-sigma regulatory factor